MTKEYFIICHGIETDVIGPMSKAEVHRMMNEEEPEDWNKYIVVPANKKQIKD